MTKTRGTSRSSLGACALVTVVALVVGLLTTTAASAAPVANFTAVGSARQVYVTGLAPSTQVSLVDGTGAVVQTKPASSLGGALFRGVHGGSGYRVRRV